MSRHQRRLDGVLRARRAQEDAARLALAGATQELARRGEMLQQASERYRQQVASTGPCEVSELLAQRQGSEYLAAGLAAARQDLAEAEQRVDVRRSEWSQAARRVAALERLVERRHLEWLAEVQRRDDLAMDDLITSRWVPARPAPQVSAR